MGLELSPFKLPLKTGVIESTDRTFDSMFGVFNDSLPDGWGRLLLDRKLMNPGFILQPFRRLIGFVLSAIVAWELCLMNLKIQLQLLIFLMDATGNWTVSPAYDLTFSSGPAGEHSTMMMGNGANSTKEHLLKLAGVGNIKRDTALEIINHVATVTKKWPDFAAHSGVSKMQTKNIENALSAIRQIAGI